ncbi:MAG: helix-turn-helix domain-containing protein [Bacteroidales bacterium]
MPNANQPDETVRLLLGSVDARIDSVGEDIVLVEPRGLPQPEGYPVKTDRMISLVCRSGSVRGTLNLEPFVAEAPCLLIVVTDQILQIDAYSADFQGQFLLMSKRFLEDMSVSIRESVPLFISVRNHPLVAITAEEATEMEEYFRLLRKAIRKENNPYRLETIHHLSLASLHGIGYMFHRMIRKTEKPKQESLVDAFLVLVRENFRTERSVGYYAGRLFLTPKYLSKAVRQSSGKTAGQWIEDHVIIEAKALLKSTNLTVQQISDRLDFSSQSFFGKYFKRRVGVSPKEFRQS